MKYETIIKILRIIFLPLALIILPFFALFLLWTSEDKEEWIEELSEMFWFIK